MFRIRSFLECLLGRLRPDCEYDSPVDRPGLEPLENVVDGLERLRLDDCLHLPSAAKLKASSKSIRVPTIGPRMLWPFSTRSKIETGIFPEADR